MLSRGLLSSTVMGTKRSGGTDTTRKNFECCSMELGEFVVAFVWKGMGWATRITKRADGVRDGMMAWAGLR